MGWRGQLENFNISPNPNPLATYITMHPYICNRPILVDNIGKWIYQSGPINYTEQVYESVNECMCLCVFL